mgnify:CR=1 FL=1|tara:strand:- start:685 stop:831 length:147 start_codon:yes stop_codon:yes gene_type:complete
MSNQEKKERKRELRRIYEEKIGKEYVEGLKKQPTYSLFEWVEIIKMTS